MINLSSSSSYHNSSIVTKNKLLTLFHLQLGQSYCSYKSVINWYLSEKYHHSHSSSTAEKPNKINCICLFTSVNKMWVAFLGTHVGHRVIQKENDIARWSRNRSNKMTMVASHTINEGWIYLLWISMLNLWYYSTSEWFLYYLQKCLAPVPCVMNKIIN